MEAAKYTRRLSSALGASSGAGRPKIRNWTQFSEAFLGLADILHCPYMTTLKMMLRPRRAVFGI